MYKIAIIGPESTGKTALAKNLADHFKAPWIPEYAREYVEKLTNHYTYDDICNIAQKQIEQELAFDEPNITGENYIFFDTDLIITKVWFSYCFRKIPDFLTERMKNSFFDLYLLCAPDLTWEPDPVREHGNDREYFFDWYKNEIEQTGKPYVIVTGTGNQRIQNAIDAIQTQLQ
ncbi:MAG TPA: ATP-binding protein [Paludibacter sp.]|nr:ATP-binding protein [Paludibacter sp.]